MVHIFLLIIVRVGVQMEFTLETTLILVSV